MVGRYWGLDIGGTKTAFLAGDDQGRVLSRQEVKTALYPSWEDLLSAVLPARGRPAAIGVSCGGPLDTARGLILSPPNLPGWDNVPVTDWLTRRFNAPAFLENDANACALAEWRFGAGKGCRNMVFLTFGTGFGAGLILDGRLYRGATGLSGELGHIRYRADGPEAYGKRGSYEGFCSGGSLSRLSGYSVKELVLQAEQGGEEAQHILRESAEALGMACAMLMDLLNPERIVIGSIFTRAEKWFREGMDAVIAREALPLTRSACRVLAAGLKDAVGDMAALTVAIDGLEGEL